MTVTKKIVSVLLSFVVLVSIFAVGSVSVDAASYTECASGTVSWQMIYDNPNTYYWKHDGNYYVLTARKSSKNYYVTLYRKSELRYLRQDKDDDSGSEHEWDSSSTKYTGGKLYTKNASTANIMADKNYYEGTSELFYQNLDAPYYVTVKIVVSGGVVTSFTATGPTANTTDYQYFSDALAGMKEQIIGKPAYKDLSNMVDIVSGATRSSQLIQDAIDIAFNGSSSGGTTPIPTPTGKTVYVYTGTSTSDSESYGEKVKGKYKATVEVRVVDGEIISMTATGATKSDDKSRFTRALNGISSALVGKEPTVSTANGVDAISNATVSSKLIKEALVNAFGKTPTTEVSSDDSAGTAYVLVSTPTAGNKYIIVNINTSGTGYVLTGTGGTTTMTVNKSSSKYNNSAYIVANNEDNVFLAEKGWKFKSVSGGSKYLAFNKNKKAPILTSSGTSFTYSSSQISCTVDKKTYGLELNSNEYRLKEGSYSKVYFYEERPVYTVTWMNGSNELAATQVEKNGTPHYPLDTYPTKEPAYSGGSWKSYSFAGWSKTPGGSAQSESNITITGDTTLYAVFNETNITSKHTVTWREWPAEDENGNTVPGTLLATQYNVPYGSNPIYTGAAPTKKSDDWYTYTFTGWYTEPYHSHGLQPSEIIVTGDMTLYPTFLATPRKYYTITWNNIDGNGTVLAESYPEGETPDLGYVPTKSPDADYTYEFSGWSPTIEPVKENKAYTAQFTSTPVKKLDDGKYIDGTTMVEYHNYTPYVIVTVADGKITSFTSVANAVDNFSKGCNDRAATAISNAVVGKPAVESTFDAVDTVSGATRSVNALKSAAKKALQASDTIKWVDYNGATLDAAKISTGTIPVYKDGVEETPTRAEDADYTYTFSGWTPSVAAVSGDAAYTATYAATAKGHTVTYDLNGGAGDITDTTKYKPNAIVTVSNVIPTREGYVFKGWKKDGEVVGTTFTMPNTDVTLIADWVQVFTVTWKNYDGTTLETDTNVENGTQPTYNGATPTKTGNAQYSYTFNGWAASAGQSSGTSEENLPTVTANVTYYAAFRTVTNTYTVTWKNDDGTVLETDKNVPYGTIPSYDGDTPTKMATAENTYTFKGWDKTLESVTGNVTYTAQFNSAAREYTITWKNDDGSVIDTTTVPYGTTPTHAAPTKNATAQYSYTFTGWTPEITSVTGNTEYTAAYSSALRSYTITWVDGNGETLKNDTVEYGKTPSYTGAVPAKTATAQYSYEFNNRWSPDITAVSGDTTYTAQFDSTVRSYTITWKNDDGSVIDTTTVNYGDSPTHGDPTKSATAEYTYAFAGWTPTLEAVTGDAAYTASYTSTVKKYIVTWTNADGTVLDTNEVAYGELPKYGGTVPEYEDTTQYSYTFVGWEPKIVHVTENAVYKAVFSAETNSYTVRWLNYDGTVLRTDYDVAYGTVPTYEGAEPEGPYSEMYDYTFSGWDREITAVVGDVSYTAQYDSMRTGYQIFVDNYTRNKAVTSLVSGKYYKNTVTFTVSANLASVVAVKNPDESYTRLYGTKIDDTTYSFTVDITDSDVYVTIALKGDVNLDGKVNTRDVQSTSKVVAMYATFDPLQKIVGDVNVDGRIRTRDVQFISKVVAFVDKFSWDVKT